MDIFKWERKWLQILKNKSRDFKKILSTGKRIHKIAFEADKKIYIAYIIVIIISSLLPFLTSWMSGRVIDTLIETTTSSETSNALITIIIISHRFSTVRNADRIVVIDNGEIIEQGSHQELLNLGGKYKKAYEIQKRGYID